jgi:hypothetical protein
VFYVVDGRIIVDVAGSAGFYKKMGFVETGEGSIDIPEMVLTTEAAKKLIEENNNRSSLTKLEMFEQRLHNLER